MSFDIFNYDPTVKEIDSTIETLTARVLTSTRRQLDIAAMYGSAKEVMSGEAKRLVESIATDNNNINDLTEIKKKIRALCDLPLVIKNQLFAVYNVMCSVAGASAVSAGRVNAVGAEGVESTAHKISLGDFASRLPLCYEGMMIDIIPLLKHSAVLELRAKMRQIYKKYELLPLPAHYRWVSPEGML